MFAKKIKLKTIKNAKGSLTVIEKLKDLNFSVKRIYYIYNNHKSKRDLNLRKKLLFYI